MLETKRLILRPWQVEDAESCYKYAKNPNIGPKAGWPAHESVENSREIIRTVLSAPNTFAVVLKETMEPIGNISLMIGKQSNLSIAENEGEIGYWIGEPYWGQGLIPEATKELMRYGFVDCQLKKLWCGYFDGNDKSRRVQEKCGFHYLRSDVKEWPLIHQTLTEHVLFITKEEWEQNKQEEATRK
ncbi:N-acetyltransferase [Erysipelotrichaceae bacterium AF19-24AC]|nr:N-acetyltransferase [Erysipelotrichaceae bacterium AF19-24AC]